MILWLNFCPSCLWCEAMDQRSGIAIDLDYLISLSGVAQRADRTKQAQGAAPRPGPFQSRRRGRGLEVEDRRVYAPGDDLRHIDWRATARLGTPFVKIFREERERTSLIALDLRPSMNFGTRRALRSYAACELAALLAWRGQKRGERLSLATLTNAPLTMPRAKAGQRAVLEMCGVMAQAQNASFAQHNNADVPFAELLQGLTRLAGKGDRIILISAFENIGPDLDVALHELTARADLIALRVEDPIETNGLPSGRYAWRGLLGAGGWANVYGGIVNSLQQKMQADSEALQAHFHHCGAGFVRVNSSLPPQAALARILEGGHDL
jgi:uncharacterized protein (DUF58 family)